MLASRNGHTEIAKYLSEAKASLDLQKQVYSAKTFDDVLVTKNFFFWDIGSDMK